MNKPNIIISKCINFENCRYDGGIIKDNFLLKLSKYVNFIPVCPEIAIGLPTPRNPIQLYQNGDKNELYQPKTGAHFTKKMSDFSKKFLENQKNIDGFILKNRSPSCGINDVKVYNKKDTHVSTIRNGRGLFTENIDDYFLNIPKEDEGRLKNFRLREEFLTKIFILAKFRNLEKSLKNLSDFQAENKYLFMFYSPSLQKILGQIIASYNKNNLDEIFLNYKDKLLELFQTETKTGKMVNALTHIFGYFKNTISKEEKDFFLDTLSLYTKGNIPTSTLTSILKTWALKDDNKYILKQTILSPYPSDLIELSDSGKKINL